jgi:hypothetical protein
MKKQIVSFIDELKSNKKVSAFDEASTKQAVVLRLLSFLGWDIFNVEEVYPDFSTNSSTISYALRIRNSSKIYIEVKRVPEKLDSYQKDLFNLASRDDVNLAILTNGITWWFYLVSASGNWKQNRFHSIDLLKQKPDIFVPNLIDLLSQANVSKGQALRTAKTLFQKKKQKLATDFLPEAWNQILTQPNKIFVELLSEATEKLCGYKVDTATVEEFLHKRLENWLIKNTTRSVAVSPSIDKEGTQILDLDKLLAATSEQKKEPSSASRKTLSSNDRKLSTTDTETIKLAKSYSEKSIKAFSFNGNTYKVQTWVEMLTTLSNYLASTNNKDFEKVLWISNEQKARFSRYGDQLNLPEKVKKTDIYVETKMSPDEVVRTSVKLLAEFGYSKDDLDIDAA